MCHLSLLPWQHSHRTPDIQSGAHVLSVRVPKTRKWWELTWHPAYHLSLLPWQQSHGIPDIKSWSYVSYITVTMTTNLWELTWHPALHPSFICHCYQDIKRMGHLIFSSFIICQCYQDNIWYSAHVSYVTVTKTTNFQSSAYVSYVTVAKTTNLRGTYYPSMYYLSLLPR